MKRLNKSTKRVINAVVWTIAAIVLMYVIYAEWSKNGVYTFMSFFASFVFHAGFCFIIGILIDDSINKEL